MANALAIRTVTVPAERSLPDNTQYTHRFHVKSASTGDLYTIAQHKNRRTWGCNCKGWIYKKPGKPRCCKHLESLGLPTDGLTPMEVNFKVQGTPKQVNGITPVSLEKFRFTPDHRLIAFDSDFAGNVILKDFPAAGEQGILVKSHHTGTMLQFRLDHVTGAAPAISEWHFAPTDPNTKVTELVLIHG